MSVTDPTVSVKDGDESSNTQIKFMAEGVISALRTPLKVAVFPRKLEFDLRLAKLDADKCVVSGLKDILNCNVGKFDTVVSVFETAAFFTEILNSCQERLSSIDVGSGLESASGDQARRENSIESGRHDSPPDFSDKHCSVQYGHRELAQELSSITLKSRKLWKLNASDEDFCDNECEFHLKSEENKFSAIITPPTTRGDFETFDVSSYLALSAFCEICSKAPTRMVNVSGTGLDIGEQVITRTLLKLKKATKTRSSYDKPVNNDRPFVSNEEVFIQSPDNGEDSDDSGVFKRFVKKMTPDNHRDSPVTANSYQETSPTMINKVNNTDVNNESAPGFTDLPVVKKSLSKMSRNEKQLTEESIPDSVIGVSYPPRENNYLISIPNGNIPVRNSVNSAENASSQKVSIRKRLSISTADKEIDTRGGRKVFVQDEVEIYKKLLKEARKKKRKRVRKKGKKLSIHLSPPAGQDLDEYLNQQLILIRAQLAAKKSTDLEVKRSTLLRSGQTTGDAFNSLPEAPPARPLEYEQVKHILGDLPPSDDRNRKTLVQYKPAKRKSNSPSSRNSPLFISRDKLSPVKPENYAYPSSDIKLRRRSPKKIQAREFKIASDADHNRIRERDYGYRYKRRSGSPPHYRDSQHYHKARDRIAYSPEKERQSNRLSPIKSKSYRSAERLINNDRDPGVRSKDVRVDPSKTRSGKTPKKEKNNPNESLNRQNKTGSLLKTVIHDDVSKLVKNSAHNNMGADVSGSLNPQTSSISSVKHKTELTETGVNSNDLPPGVDELEFMQTLSPVVEMPPSPVPDSSKALVAVSSNAVIISDDEPFLTVSEDSSPDAGLFRKVTNGKAYQKRTKKGSDSRRSRYQSSSSRSRSRSCSPGQSRRRSRRSSKSRSRSPRRKKSLVRYERGSRARTPSPSVANKNYSYSVVEMKKTVSSLASKDDPSKSMEQLETTTLYEYRSMQAGPLQPGLPYPNPHNMYPPVTYQYQQHYPYFPQQMVPYHAPPYQPRPYF